MNTRRKPAPPPAQPDGDLEVAFAQAALTGVLQDPNVNPRNTEALNTAVDFCWLIARTMVERRPAPQEGPLQ